MAKEDGGRTQGKRNREDIRSREGTAKWGKMVAMKLWGLFLAPSLAEKTAKL